MATTTAVPPMPPMPLTVGARLVVHSLGKVDVRFADYCSPHFLFPYGYRATRTFEGHRITCEIRHGSIYPLFVLRVEAPEPATTAITTATTATTTGPAPPHPHHAAPTLLIIETSADEAYRRLLHDLPGLSPERRKLLLRARTAFTAAYFFGFGDHRVRALIERLPHAAGVLGKRKATAAGTHTATVTLDSCS